MGEKFDLALLPPEPDLSFEQELWSKGICHVAGIDEAGRGSLAGPVAAAAVILPRDPGVALILKGVRDSKQMTAAQRAEKAAVIKTTALSWGVGFASAEEIDEIGILPATRLAARRALQILRVLPQALLLDYLKLPDYAIPQTALVKGDCRSLSIAAASVLAKTARDAHLCELDQRFPGYGFAQHKGYGTPAHLAALERLGPCSIHRKSFRPFSIQEAEEGQSEL